jgi:hypothetical protein
MSSFGSSQVLPATPGQEEPLSLKQELREAMTTGKRPCQSMKQRLAAAAAATPSGNPFAIDPALMSPGTGEHPSLATSAEQGRTLDRAVRWMSFIFHSHYHRDKEIKRVYGNDLLGDATLYQQARQKFLDNIKAHKGQVLTAAVNLLDELERRDENLKEMTDNEELAHYFEGKFSVANFFCVWKYMENYLDYNSSSDFGKWYCQGKWYFLCWLRSANSTSQHSSATS